VPIGPAGRKIAEAWDPAKDEAAGEQCKAYGAAGIMRIPTRLHITWQDDNTLKLETDAGTQTRTFRFRPSEDAGGGWQGVSTASWILRGRLSTTASAASTLDSNLPLLPADR
jgi:hypothetical protein